MQTLRNLKQSVMNFQTIFFYKPKQKGDIMLKKNLIAIFILGFLFTFVASVNAQEKPIEKKETKMTMQHEDMQKCMDKIAADSTMRMQMMNKMMDHAEGDNESMMQMCKMMMDNPEMHKMMMKMMHNDGMMEGGMMNHNMNMMNDSTKTMGRPEHESHQQKK